MEKTINLISPTRIDIVTTEERHQEYEKETLEAEKQSLLNKIAEIDKLMTNFTE